MASSATMPDHHSPRSPGHSPRSHAHLSGADSVTSESIFAGSATFNGAASPVALPAGRPAAPDAGRAAGVAALVSARLDALLGPLEMVEAAEAAVTQEGETEALGLVCCRLRWAQHDMGAYSA